MRRLLIIFLGFSAISAVAWFLLKPSLNGVKVSFLRTDRIYTEHEFTDVALLSFTNTSGIEVTVFGSRVLTTQSMLRGRSLPLCIHDDFTTNQLVFRTVRE